MHKTDNISNILKNKYLVYAFNYWCVIVQSFVGIIIPLIFIVFLDLKLHFIIFILSFLILNVAAWFFVRKFLLKPIEIKISEEKIVLEYLNYSATRTKKTITKTIDKIDSFSDFSNGHDLKFKLYCSNGQSITLFKSGLWYRKDDFKKLQNDFRLFISEFNNNSNTIYNSKGKTIIKYGDNTYLNAAIVFFVGALFMALSFISSISSDEKEPINYNLFIGFSILLVLGFLYLGSHRKAKKNNDQ
jgi:hypothetical protein